jgi:hypothetical protein
MTTVVISWAVTPGSGVMIGLEAGEDIGVGGTAFVVGIGSAVGEDAAGIDATCVEIWTGAAVSIGAGSITVGDAGGELAQAVITKLARLENNSGIVLMLYFR